MRLAGRQRGRAELRGAGEQRLHHLAAARIGNVHEVDPGAQLEQLHREVPLGADPGRRIVELAGRGLGLGDEVEHRLRDVVLRQHQVGRGAEQRDRHEILVRVERHALVQQRIDHQRRGAEQQRVAVGPGARRRCDADIAAGAAAVLDHDRLPELLRKRIGNDARQDVDRTTGGERNDQADLRGRRIFLRQRRRSECNAARRARPGQESAAASGMATDSLRSSPRKRGPRGHKGRFWISRLRGNERWRDVAPNGTCPNSRSTSSTPCGGLRRCGASSPASHRSGRCHRSPPAP